MGKFSGSIAIVSVVIAYIILSYSNGPVSMANNGILFVSNAAKAHKLCTKVSNVVKNVLYIKLYGEPESALSILNKQIVNIYSKCWAYDVRLMLKPWDTVSKIKTNNPIQVIIFDKELAKEADKLKLSIDNVKDDLLLKQIGD